MHAEIILPVHRLRYFEEVNGLKKEKLTFLHEFGGGLCGIASPRGFEDLLKECQAKFDSTEIS